MTEGHPGRAHAIAAVRGGWRMRSFGGVIRIWLCLLPVAALITGYLLITDHVTVVSQAALARASYGWPVPWVVQDLSRYGADAFPLTIAFNWTRAWHDPIATAILWPALICNVLIVAVVITAAFFAIVAVIRRITRRGGRAA